MRTIELGGKPGLKLSRARGRCDQHAGVGRPAQQRHEEIGRGGVGPVEVVEDEHERLGGGELLQQHAYSAVGAIALVEGRRQGHRRVGEGRKQLSELGADSRIEPLEAAGVEPFDVVLERVDEDPERQVLLELGA